MHTFPDLLKQIRAKANLTQEDLAKVLGVSTVLITMIETGKKQVSRNFIQKLAEKLGVNPSSITPFALIEKDINLRKLSGIERSLVEVGQKLQDYLIEKKARKLNR